MDRMIQKIVVPVDFSPASIRAARYAWRMASHFGAFVYLIHVMEIPANPDGPFGLPSAQTAKPIEFLHQDARARLSAIADQLGASPGLVATEVRHGAIAENLAEAARHYGADLVVMSTHGRTGLSHLLMGSVAEQVIRAAHCPVLVLRDSGQVQVHRQPAA